MEAPRMEGIIVRMGVMKLSHWPHSKAQDMYLCVLRVGG